jgi:release factor glutamine methyltransferase
MNTLKVLYSLQYISSQLFPVYKDPHLCEYYAWLLLEKLYNKTKTELIISEIIPLTFQQNKLLEEWLNLLIEKKIPIQYVLGSVYFNDLEILVKPPILIPRPETEEWSINIVTQLKKLKNQHLQILDIATGSGCIACTFAYHLPHAYVTATDISLDALQLAHTNSLYNKIDHITFLQSDLFNNISLEHFFDVIVTNPPYIAESERENIDESVLNWEDEHALFAPDNGLGIITKIIDNAPLYLKHNEEMKHLHIPQLIIEIGHQQGSFVKNYMIKVGYNNVHIYKDLAKKDRIAVGRIDNVANSNLAK